MADLIITPVFRVSYPNVFEPRINTLNKKMEYSLVALFKHGEDLSKLRKAAEAAVVKKWGADRAKWPKGMRTPFRDQADKEKDMDGKLVMPEGHTKGAIYLNLKSTTRPGVVDENVQPIMDAEKFYAGCYAIAQVSCYTYDQAGNKGVNFGLENVQFVKDGESFSGRVRAEAAFSPIATSSGGAEADASEVDPFSV